MALIVDFPQARGRPLPSWPARSVSFADRLEVEFIEKHSDKYNADLWFSEDELASFKRHTVTMLRAIHSSNLTLAQLVEMNVRDTSPFMGLEIFLVRTRAGRGVRRTLWIRVLGEQRQQRRLGINDPDRLAMISEAASKWSREWARIIGLIHAER